MTPHDRAQESLKRFIRSRYELIRPEPTQGMFNFRCYENAVEYQRLHPELEVVEVIYMDDGVPILHYINFDPANNKYLETTLGYRAPQLEYYKIRRIHPDDYPHIQKEFERSLESWLEQFTSWWGRKLFRIDRIV